MSAVAFWSRCAATLCRCSPAITKSSDWRKSSSNGSARAQRSRRANWSRRCVVRVTMTRPTLGSASSSRSMHSVRRRQARGLGCVPPMRPTPRRAIERGQGISPDAPPADCSERRRSDRHLLLGARLAVAGAAIVVRVGVDISARRRAAAIAGLRAGGERQRRGEDKKRATPCAATPVAIDHIGSLHRSPLPAIPGWR